MMARASEPIPAKSTNQQIAPSCRAASCSASASAASYARHGDLKVAATGSGSSNHPELSRRELFRELDHFVDQAAAHEQRPVGRKRGAVVAQ